MAPLPDYLSKGPVGKERLSKEVLAEHQRERILEAAIAVFAKRGYQGSTVDNIVAAAKISVGSFYGLFDGKEDCFLRAYDTVVADSRQRILDSLPADGEWADQLLAGLTSLLHEIAAAPMRARIVLVESQTAGLAARARYEATLDELLPFLRSGRSLRPRGRELPETLEPATVAGVAWLLHQRLAAGESKQIEKLLPELTQILAEPYLGEEATEQLLSTTLSG